MRRKLVVLATMLLAASLPWDANASTFDFSFAGPGVSGKVELTFGTVTDAKDTQGFEVTGITGTFSDSNNALKIVNAAIGPLEPVSHDAPEPTNMLAPYDFSRYAVINGLPAESHGSVTFDNLYYPGGSPPTATSYPVHGGFLDIYGLLFDIGGGRVVNVWSNGDFTETGAGPVDYGVAVATQSTALDYIGNSVSVSPEPGEVGLLGLGLAAILAWRRGVANRKV